LTLTGHLAGRRNGALFRVLLRGLMGGLPSLHRSLAFLRSLLGMLRGAAVVALLMLLGSFTMSLGGVGVLLLRLAVRRGGGVLWVGHGCTS